MKQKTAIAIWTITLLTFLSGLSSRSSNIPLAANSGSFFKSGEMTLAPKQANSDGKLVNANTQFGFRLFSELVKSSNNQNVFFSPASVAIALSMLYNGASGTTQQEMAAAMSFGSLDLKAVNAANESLREALQNADTKVQLSIANSLWARQGFSFRHQFLKNTRQFYQAQVTNLDFASPDAIGIINLWVEESTRGKISQIVDRINPDDVLFLINAIYFKGTWTNQFDKNQTAQQPFYLSNGTSKQHPLMSRQGNYRYYENQQFQAVSLPYGIGQLSLYVLLPKKNSNLNALLGQLSAQNWNQWLSQLKNREGVVKIPRFKLEYEIELKNALAALGMKTMFDGTKAEFAALTSERVRVDRVKHKTFVEVNEEGTEASAVTSAGVQVTSAPATEPFSMVVDRPFFCAIRDERTGTILFMGAIVEPKF
jgi:serpin B